MTALKLRKLVVSAVTVPLCEGLVARVRGLGLVLGLVLVLALGLVLGLVRVEGGVARGGCTLTTSTAVVAMAMTMPASALLAAVPTLTLGAVTTTTPGAGAGTGTAAAAGPSTVVATAATAWTGRVLACTTWCAALHGGRLPAKHRHDAVRGCAGSVGSVSCVCVSG